MSLLMIYYKLGNKNSFEDSSSQSEDNMSLSNLLQEGETSKSSDENSKSQTNSNSKLSRFSYQLGSYFSSNLSWKNRSNQDKSSNKDKSFHTSI